MDHRTFWNKRAANYNEVSDRYFAEAYQATIENIKNHVDGEMDILEIGCGTGIVTNEIAPSVKHILAIDISERMLSIAQQKAQSAGINNVDYLMTTLEKAAGAAKKYDCILACNLLHLIEDIDSFLYIIHTALKENGLFISVTDCYGEKRSIRSVMIKAGHILGSLPYIRSFQIQELKKTIETNGFNIIDEKNFIPNPPNYFIVSVKKQAYQ